MKRLTLAPLLTGCAPALDHECMPTNAALLSALRWALEFADNVLHLTITWSC